MSIDTIKTHMNEHHVEELKSLINIYGGFKPHAPKLIDVDKNGLTIQADGKEVFVPFPNITEEKDYKNAIIALCANIEKRDDAVSVEIESFRDGFNSIILASLSSDKKPCISYSPLLKYQGNYYLYISEVAQHFGNLKTNPDCMQVMFIEDETKTKSILARKRLVYDAVAEFLPRDNLFNSVFDNFENCVGKGGGVSTVRQMLDFHLVKIHFKQGRFVKGFGQAYNINEEGKIEHIGSNSMPHAMPHKK